MPPTRRTTGGNTSGKSRTRSYTKKDGTKVHGYSTDRDGTGDAGLGSNWGDARKAWAGAGIGAVTTVGLLLQTGFTLISGAAMILTALFTLGALTVNAKAGAKQNKARRRIATNRAARPRTTTARRRTTSTRRRTTTRRRR